MTLALLASKEPQTVSDSAHSEAETIRVKLHRNVLTWRDKEGVYV